MVALKFAALALAAFCATSVVAQIPEELEVEDLLLTAEDWEKYEKEQGPKYLNVGVQASFPQADIFGIKLVNGHATQAVLDVTNHEEDAVTVAIIGGFLTTPPNAPGAPEQPVVLRNLTAQRYGISVPSGASESLSYAFATEMHPQDLGLNLVAVLQSRAGAVYTVNVYNGTVAVVEAPVSIFDPQVIFLYVFLAVSMSAVLYYLFTTWAQVLMPAKRKDSERPKRPAGAVKKATSPAPAKAGDDADATTTGAKAYDESWIPQEHLKRPESKRVGSGRPKSRAA